MNKNITQEPNIKTNHTNAGPKSSGFQKNNSTLYERPVFLAVTGLSLCLRKYAIISSGSVAEWLKAHDSKSCGQQCLGGSNPLASAKMQTGELVRLAAF